MSPAVAVARPTPAGFPDARHVVLTAARQLPGEVNPPRQPARPTCRETEGPARCSKFRAALIVPGKPTVTEKPGQPRERYRVCPQQAPPKTDRFIRRVYSTLSAGVEERRHLKRSRGDAANRAPNGQGPVVFVTRCHESACRPNKPARRLASCHLHTSGADF